MAEITDNTVIETGAEVSEKTFTQAEVDKIIKQRVSRATKGMPTEEELEAFNNWKVSQQTEAEKMASLIEERDNAKAELKALQEKAEKAERTNYMLKKGLTGDETEFIEFKALKMVDDKTTFEKAVDELVKDKAHSVSCRL